MLPQRLSLQVDNAFFRPAILGKPLRNAASMRLGRILVRRRRRQIRVRDLFGHFLSLNVLVLYTGCLGKRLLRTLSFLTSSYRNRESR